MGRLQELGAFIVKHLPGHRPPPGSWGTVTVRLDDGRAFVVDALDPKLIERSLRNNEAYGASMTRILESEAFANARMSATLLDDAALGRAGMARYGAQVRENNALVGAAQDNLLAAERAGSARSLATIAEDEAAFRGSIRAMEARGEAIPAVLAYTRSSLPLG